eukprot:XP_011675510.1 PREDICTED: UDP-glucuronosyltransferase 2A3-like [Strongylocentrotus purpuratus]
MTSYQPAPLTSFTSDMTFLQRFRNTVTYLFFVFWGNKMMINVFSTGLADEYDLDPRLKSTISNHVDLFLINSDFSVEFPFAMMPNIIPVGGLTTRSAEALDNELENFMQSSGKHGVILFSLGSYFASITKSRPDIIRMFIDAFSRLPHKVLLHLKEPPPRGGSNGIGLGTKIDKDRLSADYIYQQLSEVLENTSYSTNAKRVSAIFRDRPMTPANTAAFWIEHVIKHGGGHLHPPTHNLAFFQIYLLDIAAFGILLVGILFFIIKRSIRWCCCRKKIVKSKRD